MKIRKSIACISFAFIAAAGLAKEWPGFSVGMGMGGWLTNYKRFNVLPENKRMHITEGDLVHFDTYITEGDVARVKMWGFDHIRVGFDQIVLEESPGKWRERTFAKLVEFAGWCAKHKINAVFNLHKAVGNYCDITEKVELIDSPELHERFIALWIEIERRMKNYPEVAFELLNEVRNVNPEKWNALADRTLKAIRAVNRDRWVVIGSTCWNSPATLKHLKIWDDPRVVYTFHMYSPHNFTHQRGVLQAGPLYDNSDVKYPGRAFLERELKPALDWAAAHPDKILWNGEFGTIRHISPIDRASYMRDIISICRGAGIPWCVWNYLSTPNDGNRFSLVDDVTRDFLTDDLMLACLGRGDAAATKELKYMCFNIWGNYFGNPVYERDLKQAAYVIRNAPDILGMQEVTPAFWKSRLFVKLRDYYGIIRAEGKPKYEFNPLLWRKSRLDLIEGGTHIFAAEDNPEGSKGFGWGVFRDKSTGRKLIAYSTHLWWKQGPADREMRHRNAKELLAKMSELKKKYNCPVVGGGDLNCTVNQQEKGILTPLPDFGKEGFLNAQYTVPGASQYSSNHGDPRRDALGIYRGWIRPEAGDPKNSLDQVHYTSGVKPLTLLVDRAQDALEVSDHSPVIFTFTID